MAQQRLFEDNVSQLAATAKKVSLLEETITTYQTRQLELQEELEVNKRHRRETD